VLVGIGGVAVGGSCGSPSRRDVLEAREQMTKTAEDQEAIALDGRMEARGTQAAAELHGALGGCEDGGRPGVGSRKRGAEAALNPRFGARRGARRWMRSHLISLAYILVG
jgi:hypothetical protein